MILRLPGSEHHTPGPIKKPDPKYFQNAQETGDTVASELGNWVAGGTFSEYPLNLDLHECIPYFKNHTYFLRYKFPPRMRGSVFNESPVVSAGQGQVGKCPNRCYIS